MSTASAYLTVRGIDVDVVYKDIKNLHIGVYPPMGRVRVAAPEAARRRTGPPGGHPAPAVDQAAARAAAGRGAPVRARDGHRRVALRLGSPPPAEGHRAAGPRARRGRRRPTAALRAGRHRQPSSAASCSTAGTASSSAQPIPDLIAKWEPMLEVSVPRWSIRRMKTKWGSCNRETGHIWFNVELAKKHPDCLEYIVVHEMTHLPRARPRRALHQAHGRLHAGLAQPPRPAEQCTPCERRMGRREESLMALWLVLCGRQLGRSPCPSSPRPSGECNRRAGARECGGGSDG